jgi:GST-like protein
MQPIQFYYWPTPNGWKVSIALEEMEIPYELHPVNIGGGDQFTPDFLAISPNNRVPAIVDPEATDGAPISVFESGAILQYLSRKSGASSAPTNAPGSKWDSGCSGRWGGWAPWPARRTISGSTQGPWCRTSGTWPMAWGATPMRSTGSMAC